MKIWLEPVLYTPVSTTLGVGVDITEFGYVLVKLPNY
jgi:hypothetical protein